MRSFAQLRSYLLGLVRRAAAPTLAQADAGPFPSLQHASGDRSTTLVDFSGDRVLQTVSVNNSAVWVRATSAISGGVATVSAAGDDAAVGLDLASKSTDPVRLLVNGSAVVTAAATSVTLAQPLALGAAADASALVTLASTTQGLLLPRMTGAERDAIAAPATGLLIYNTTTNKLNFRAAAAWEAVTSA
jgi:hypothetical protein